jgi:hypothetical protein
MALIYGGGEIYIHPSIQFGYKYFVIIVYLVNGVFLIQIGSEIFLHLYERFGPE